MTMSDEEYRPPIAKARRRTTPVSTWQPDTRARSSADNPAESVSPNYEVPATNTASRRRSSNDPKASTGIPISQNRRSGSSSSSRPLHSPSAGLPYRPIRLALFLLLLYVATMCYRYQHPTHSLHSHAQMIRDSQPPLKTLDTFLESFQEIRRLPGMLNVTTPKDYDDLFKALDIAPSRKKSREIKQDLSPLASLLRNLNRASLDLKMFVMAQKLLLLEEIRPSMEVVADVGEKGLDRLSDIPDWIDSVLNALSVVVPVIQRHHTYDPYIRRLRIFTDDMHRELGPLIHRGINVQNLVHNIIFQVEQLNYFLEDEEISFASKCIPSSSRLANLPKMCSLIHISQVLKNSTQALQNLRYEVEKATVSLERLRRWVHRFFKTALRCSSRSDRTFCRCKNIPERNKRCMTSSRHNVRF
ncbi:hypothetical protein BDV97DRAFT_170046 [Delphinella strobiligena]|nr:hypothetical protein BDV97DRAFT_170046 [Delphinella strobiligena]